MFNAAGLTKYWFPVTRMPKNGDSWTLLSDMIRKNQRLQAFTSKSDKKASEGITYEWRYAVTNVRFSQLIKKKLLFLHNFVNYYDLCN